MSELHVMLKWKSGGALNIPGHPSTEAPFSVARESLELETYHAFDIPLPPSPPVNDCVNMHPMNSNQICPENLERVHHKGTLDHVTSRRSRGDSNMNTARKRDRSVPTCRQDWEENDKRDTVNPRKRGFIKKFKNIFKRSSSKGPGSKSVPNSPSLDMDSPRRITANLPSDSVVDSGQAPLKTSSKMAKTRLERLIDAKKEDRRGRERHKETARVKKSTTKHINEKSRDSDEKDSFQSKSQSNKFREAIVKPTEPALLNISDTVGDGSFVKFIECDEGRNTKTSPISPIGRKRHGWTDQKSKCRTGKKSPAFGLNYYKSAQSDTCIFRMNHELDFIYDSSEQISSDTSVTLSSFTQGKQNDNENRANITMNKNATCSPTSRDDTSSLNEEYLNDWLRQIQLIDSQTLQQAKRSLRKVEFVEEGSGHDQSTERFTDTQMTLTEPTSKDDNFMGYHKSSEKSIETSISQACEEYGLKRESYINKSATKNNNNGRNAEHLKEMIDFMRKNSFQETSNTLLQASATTTNYSKFVDIGDNFYEMPLMNSKAGLNLEKGEISRVRRIVNTLEEKISTSPIIPSPITNSPSKSLQEGSMKYWAPRDLTDRFTSESSFDSKSTDNFPPQPPFIEGYQSETDDDCQIDLSFESGSIVIDAPTIDSPTNKDDTIDNDVAQAHLSPKSGLSESPHSHGFNPMQASPVCKNLSGENTRDEGSHLLTISSLSTNIDCESIGKMARYESDSTKTKNEVEHSYMSNEKKDVLNMDCDLSPLINSRLSSNALDTPSTYSPPNTYQSSLKIVLSREKQKSQSQPCLLRNDVQDDDPNKTHVTDPVLICDTKVTDGPFNDTPHDLESNSSASKALTYNLIRVIPFLENLNSTSINVQENDYNSIGFGEHEAVSAEIDSIKSNNEKNVYVWNQSASSILQQDIIRQQPKNTIVQDISEYVGTWAFPRENLITGNIPADKADVKKPNPGSHLKTPECLSKANQHQSFLISPDTKSSHKESEKNALENDYNSAESEMCCLSIMGHCNDSLSLEDSTSHWHSDCGRCCLNPNYSKNTGFDTDNSFSKSNGVSMVQSVVATITSTDKALRVDGFSSSNVSSLKAGYNKQIDTDSHSVSDLPNDSSCENIFQQRGTDSNDADRKTSQPPETFSKSVADSKQDKKVSQRSRQIITTDGTGKSRDYNHRKEKSNIECNYKITDNNETINIKESRRHELNESLECVTSDTRKNSKTSSKANFIEKVEPTVIDSASSISSLSCDAMTRPIEQQVGQKENLIPSSPTARLNQNDSYSSDNLSPESDQQETVSSDSSPSKSDRRLPWWSHTDTDNEDESCCEQPLLKRGDSLPTATNPFSSEHTKSKSRPLSTRTQCVPNCQEHAGNVNNSVYGDGLSQEKSTHLASPRRSRNNESDIANKNRGGKQLIEPTNCGTKRSKENMKKSNKYGSMDVISKKKCKHAEIEPKRFIDASEDGSGDRSEPTISTSASQSEMKNSLRRMVHQQRWKTDRLCSIEVPQKNVTFFKEKRPRFRDTKQDNSFQRSRPPIVANSDVSRVKWSNVRRSLSSHDASIWDRNRRNDPLQFWCDEFDDEENEYIDDEEGRNNQKVDDEFQFIDQNNIDLHNVGLLEEPRGGKMKMKSLNENFDEPMKTAQGDDVECRQGEINQVNEDEKTVKCDQQSGQWVFYATMFFFQFLIHWLYSK